MLTDCFVLHDDSQQHPSCLLILWFDSCEGALIRVGFSTCLPRDPASPNSHTCWAELTNEMCTGVPLVSAESAGDCDELEVRQQTATCPIGFLASSVP
jgi:hypothetical protein